MASKYLGQALCIITLTLAFGAAACVGQVVPARSTGDGEAQRSAQDLLPSVSEEAAQPSQTLFSSVDDATIRLPRALVGVPLLETRELTTTGAVPEFVYVKPRILYFKLYPAYVALFESNPVSAHQDLRADHLVDTFALDDARDDTVSFKAPQLPRGISFDTPYDITMETVNVPMRPNTRLEVDNAVLEDATLTGDTLRMRHVVYARPVSESEVTAYRAGLSTYYVKTTLAPYRPSSTFAPLEASGDHYFSVARVTPSTGAWVYRAMHWDMHPSHDPITFGLSRQMPASAAQAVSEGLEYWNRVVGRIILQVERGVDLADRGGPRKVPVHWLTWDTAPSSYAPAQPDPVTGEILAASLVLASSFAVCGEQLAKEALLFAQPDGSGSAPPLPMPPHSVKNFTQRVQGDTLRLVAAHESGHALGLRHNFAGALDAELKTPEQLSEAMRQYLAGENPNHYASTTVMGYTGKLGYPLLGAYIKDHVLPYDVSALALLDMRPENTTPPLEAFCGDEDVGRVYGCTTNIDGADTLQATANRVRDARLSLAGMLLETLTAAVSKNHNQLNANVYNHVSLEDLVYESAEHAYLAYKAFDASDAVLVRQRLGALKHLDPTTYRYTVQDHIRGRAKDLGGLPGWLGLAWGASSGTAPKPGWLAHDIAFHIRRGGTPRFATSPGKTQDWVEQMALAWSERLEQLFIQALLDGITGNRVDLSANPLLAFFGQAERPSFPSVMFHPAWETPLASLATELILATRNDGSPTYAHEVRLSAVRLLDPSTFGQASYAKAPRDQLLKALDERTDAALDDPHNKLLQQRAQNDLEIFTALRRVF